MTKLFSRFYAALGQPVRGRARVILMALLIPLGASFFFPLWQIRMKAPQYPQGLSMYIYANHLTGGNGGHDVTEINNLNHYIGMMKIDQKTIPDLGWIPFAFGILALLALRCAAVGGIRDLIDLSALLVYVTCFFFARFVIMLYAYGHHLDSHAAVKIEPFMPVIFGTKQVANFTTHSYPHLGTLFVGIFALGVILTTAWHLLRELRRAEI